VIVVVRQSVRSFVERVDFVTSVATGQGRVTVRGSGSPAPTKKIITDLGVLEPTGRRSSSR